MTTDHLPERHIMLHIRHAIILGIAATLAACGGTPANPVSTPDSHVEQMNVEGAESPAVAAVLTAQPELQSTNALAASIGTAPDPASLADGTFEVEVHVPQGTVVLTPVPPVDDETPYVFADFTPADDIIQSNSISFQMHERVNGAWYYSQVQLRLPAGATPGTYEIVSNALLMDENTVGAYVDNFTDDDLTEYVFYEQFEGTITITDIDDERVSGSFAFLGRTEEGHVANVTGAFNNIGDSFKWLNQGSY